MYLSKYTLIVPFPGKKYPFAILNSLSGSFDLATQQEANEISLFKAEGKELSKELADYLLERGYAYITSKEEDKLFREKKVQFNAVVENDPTQILFALTYNCNLSCTYCFQKDMENKGELATFEIVDRLFDAVKKILPYELTPPFITLFGGEPLINTPKQRELLEYIIEKANTEKYGIAVVTNGYNLKEYVPLLKKAYIREIQVTIDGTREHHDARRFKGDGSGTYQKIMEAIAVALENQLPINFRVVVDKENMLSLVELAKELDVRGWLDLPENLFKTQLGRNYELFDCYKTPQHLYSQAEMWEAFVELAKNHPVLKKFHRAELKGLKYLVQTGNMPLPSFDTCPGCKKEWAFDLYGNIYPCTANVGREEYKVGTFFPEYELNQESIAQWQTRDITAIAECVSCDVALQCGGGCAVIAKNNFGKLHAPDCRPIKELYVKGFEFYEKEILEMSEE